jgi:hypothetical protein
MAIIVDPDNLDRQQVIFGTEVNYLGAKRQQISLRDVGTVVSSALQFQSGGIATSSSLWFTGALGTNFITHGAVAGNVLAIFTKEDAGHWVIQSVDTETTLTINTTNNLSFTGSAPVRYSVHNATGGSIVDGVTEQTVYSFAKEEWRVDTQTLNLDDLIRHPFPFEAITREQMEIGGGVSHDNWDYNTRDKNFTKKKVRTGGWAHKNPANTTIDEYTGIITLGSLDTDAQVYFQLLSASASPGNFAFTGPVNEAILVRELGGLDSRTFLKLFIRKKYRTYDQSEIADIGVDTLETIVNRFPLTHNPDPAITTKDGDILGNGIFRRTGSTPLATGANGVKTISERSFFSSGATFVANGIIVGDTLNITNGNEIGFYTIENVQPTSVTCSVDADFTSWGQTESSLTFRITSPNVFTGGDRVDDGNIRDLTGVTGELSSSTDAGFTGNVAPGDMLIINEPATGSQGVYKVLTVVNDNVLTINTSDYTWPTAVAANIDYRLVFPGMYLQFQDRTIELVNGGQFTFQATPPALTRSLGSWTTDGVTNGTVITVADSTLNDGSFTVKSVESATDLTLVPTDTLVVEGPVTVTSGAFDAFKRTIAGETYAFRWRLFGNDSSLLNAYQFVQHQLRQSADIDYSLGTNNPSGGRGDITDLLMTFATPTGQTFDMYIDDLAAADTNNVTYRDATGKDRVEAFVSAGSILFNTNLQTDSNAIYAMFFTNDDAGTNLGRDYGTPTAIVVKDNDLNDVTGSIGGAASVSFTYDYDNNVQRGVGSAGTNAPVTVVCIGLNTAQFVIVQQTIERSKNNTFSLVAALERNYEGSL